jgi:proton-translocating NAD(P)+ transhydrogenase subunit alpha
MIIGIPKETCPGERRVAMVPSLIPLLTKAGHTVIVEKDAGLAAGYPDAEFVDRGGKILESRASLFKEAGAVFMVRGLGANPEAGKFDLELLQPGQVFIGFLEPLSAFEEADALAQTSATAFAMELIPRITKAQSMDALSSMANIAGYKSVLLAANELPKLFPMMITAAGSISPAKVFIVGVGVAGLQACATAKRLGAVVSAYDLRPVVKEQVESVGAKFVEFDLPSEDSEDVGGYAKAKSEEFYRRQQEEMAKTVAQNDVVITTAAVPGKKAPILITEEMVRGMSPGSVIVDVAAERGGNCELTVPGETVEKHGVTIMGPDNIPSMLPYHASQMLVKNMITLFNYLIDDHGNVATTSEDPIIKETLLCRDGKVVHSFARELAGWPSLEN